MPVTLDNISIQSSNIYDALSMLNPSEAMVSEGIIGPGFMKH